MLLQAQDHRILRELSLDGRMSNVDLAKRVHMSESACLRRVALLESAGVIAGYRAVINHAALGFSMAAYIFVNLDQRGEKDVRPLMALIRDEERIMSCAIVTGPYDLIVHALVRDVNDLTALTLDKFMKSPLVRDIATSVVLRSYKNSEPLLPAQEEGAISRG